MAVKWSEVVSRLTGDGEPMSQAELRTCLLALTGQESVIDPSVTAGTIAHDILGFEDNDAPPDTA